jgi:putative PIN family toxin of toxin-antitoxin system
MKAVLDSMMWVSYSTHADGPRAWVIDRAVRHRVRLFTSEYILGEVRRVLVERFESPERFAGRSARVIRGLAAVVDLPPTNQVGDAGDSPVIQTALSGTADVLVTADKLLLALRKVRDVEIISLDEFAARLPPDV